MRILEEVSIAVAVAREAFSSLVRWYKRTRRDVLLARVLSTPEGRAAIAKAMVSPRRCCPLPVQR
jgi:hypothetical protein